MMELWVEVIHIVSPSCTSPLGPTTSAWNSRTVEPSLMLVRVTQ